MDKQFSILIVDDEPINIRVLTAALKDEYYIFTAQSGYDAITQLKEHTPDLILLDVMMPELDGYDVCCNIKSDTSFADIPVIFLTSLDSLEGELRGLELGGIDYLTKPVNINLLKLRVRNHLEVKERNDLVREQRDLLARKNEEFRQGMIGELLEVLVLQPEDALSTNFIRVRVPKQLPVNEWTSVRITGVEEGGLRAI